MKKIRFASAVALMLAPCLVAQKAAPPRPSPEEKSLMSAISADSMRGDVSFLASDLLEGRDTPSRGLEIAAEYLASQFRALGLKPAGTDGYFQVAEYAVVQPVTSGFSLTLESAGAKYDVKADKVMVTAMKAAEAAAMDVVQIDLAGELPGRAAVEGKAVLLKSAGRMNREAMRMRDQIRGMGPALVISFTPFMSRRPQLRQTGAEEAAAAPTIAIQDADLQKQINEAGPLKATFSIPAPVMEPAKLKNVVAVLEGSDPVLKHQYIILSGHYDHTGVNPRGSGDRIMNGANDDASGTSVALEIARAFVKSGLKPKRSLVFAHWFGEEKGLFGSSYYAANPAFPLKDTVAMMNFEHMGRTDDTEGSTKGRMSLTGIDYTEIGQFMAEAGKVAGIEVYKHDKNSDPFFSRSDNQPFADMGVPAHAVLGCYIFPDYHRPGDEWQKLDYDNMAQLTRVVAVGTWRMANRAKPPAWSAANPKTSQYVKASQELYGTK